MSEPTSPQARASVSLTTHPLWRLRAAREMPRYLMIAASAAGLVASARFALAPPRAPAAPRAASPAVPVDRAAEGFATLFARRYLSWSAGEAQAPAHALDAFVGAGMEAEAGPIPPPTGEQRVEWAEVVQARNAGIAGHVYTVAAQTDTAGLLYLTVTVVRRAGGGLALAGYPALVGAPAAAPAQLPGHAREVGDAALATVVERALRNYLAGSASELEADLAPGARVSLPAPPLRLESVGRLGWSADGRSVVALVHAQDQRGVGYTLSYELDVVHAQGRWEVAAVQMDPDA